MLTRRKFLLGVFGLAAISTLPRAKAAPIEPEPEPTVAPKWEMLVYGTPIIYTRGLLTRDVQ